MLVAHGTASVPGSATLARLAAAVAAARPEVAVRLAFLDVAAPRLADALDDHPTVIVPLLLSTGYHVRSDIPAAAAPYPGVRVARHLGPHPLLAAALADRLGPVRGPVLLVGAGSSRPEAAAELAVAGAQLASLLGSPVVVRAVSDDLGAALSGAPEPVAVATYLLAEGTFVDTIRAAVGTRAPISAPLGAHPAVIDLVWQRYDSAQSYDTDESRNPVR